MKIVFMGTPDFAIPTLEALIERGHTVAGVVTQPDKPQGRHMTLTPPPVKKRAIELGLQVYQPETLKNEAFKETLGELAPELIVVVAYGKILPEYILDYPKYGCINLHGSILPKYRGAAPMQRAIIEGQEEIGATVMYMEKGLDTGDMLSVMKFKLEDSMNFEDVHDKLSIEGAALLADTVEKMTVGQKGIPQCDEESTYAAKIDKSDLVLSFDVDARTLHNRVRGLSPIPLSYGMLNGRKIKFKKTVIAEETSVNGECGLITEISSKGIKILCAKGSVYLTELVPEGKKPMSAEAFVNGRGASVGDKFYN